jgi:two-component system heavy metal sensor histidine kinase CusS
MPEWSWLPRGLGRKLALWIALSTSVSLAVFAAVAIGVAVLQEQAEPEPDAPEVIEREARAEVGEAMLVAAPIAIVLAVAGAVIATRSALRPLDRVIETAARISARELNERLPLPAAEGEVRDLVLALNGLLGRLESGFTALDRFAAEASHELRTPLTVIATEVEVMLQNPRSSPDWEASARLCLDEVRHLAELVSALLGMARAERAVASATPGVGLGVLVERVRFAAAPQARARGVRLHVNLDTGAERAVSVDGDALISALGNVVDNAVRYTPRGGEVRIWSASSQSDDAVLVHVDDNGPGIEADERERIFEPFARSAAGKAAMIGFGLGLTITRRICEHTKTQLEVGRSPSGGARFSFAIPAAPPGQLQPPRDRI